MGTEKPLAIGLPLWVRLQPDTSVHSSRASPCASHTFPRTDFALLSTQRTLWFYRTTSKARSLRHFLGKLEPTADELRPLSQFHIGICQTSVPRKETPTSEWRGDQEKFSKLTSQRAAPSPRAGVTWSYREVTWSRLVGCRLRLLLC